MPVNTMTTRRKHTDLKRHQLNGLRGPHLPQEERHVAVIPIESNRHARPRHEWTDL